MDWVRRLGVGTGGWPDVMVGDFFFNPRAFFVNLCMYHFWERYCYTLFFLVETFSIHE